MQSQYRLLPSPEGHVVFQAQAPAHAIHRGSLDRGVQTVLEWTRKDCETCLWHLLYLTRRPHFERVDGFKGQEMVPRVVPIHPGQEARPGTVCRVVVEADSAEANSGMGVITVSLSPEGVEKLAQRLLRRCGLKLVCPAPGNQLMCIDGPAPQEEEEDLPS